MAVEHAIKLLESRGNETVTLLSEVIDAVLLWQELANNPQDSHLIDLMRVNQATIHAVHAFYKLEQHSTQYRKLATSGIPPHLVEAK